MNDFHNYFLTHEGPLVGLLCLEKFQKHWFQPLRFNISIVGFSTLYFFQTLADCVELHFYSTFRKADIIFLKLVFFYFPLHLFLTSNGDIYLFPWNDWPWDSFLKNTKFLRWNFYLIWSEKTKYFAMSCKMKLVFQIFYKLIITIHYYLKCKKHLKANLLFYLYSCKRNYILN